MAVNSDCGRGVQVSKLIRVLDAMATKSVRSHRVQGGLELAGRLTGKHIRGERHAATGRFVHEGITKAPEVFHSHAATIHYGSFFVRTAAGTVAHGQTHTDQYVYVPFRSGRTQNPCVMKIKQLVVVRREGMGWPDDEARLAVGTFWDHLRQLHLGSRI